MVAFGKPCALRLPVSSSLYPSIRCLSAVEKQRYVDLPKGVFLDGVVYVPRTVLTPLFSFKPAKLRSFTIKTRVKQVIYTVYTHTFDLKMSCSGLSFPLFFNLLLLLCGSFMVCSSCSLYALQCAESSNGE